MKQPSDQNPVATETNPKPEKRRRIVRMVRLIGGWTLIGLGILGLFLPFLQGILMIAAGVALLYKESPFVARQVDRIKPHYRLMKMKYSAWKSKRRRKT